MAARGECESDGGCCGDSSAAARVRAGNGENSAR